MDEGSMSPGEWREAIVRTSALLFTFMDMTVSTSKSKNMMDIEANGRQARHKTDEMVTIAKLQD